MLNRIEAAFAHRRKQCGFAYATPELRLQDPPGELPVEEVPATDPGDPNRHFVIRNPASQEFIFVRIDHWLYRDRPGNPRRCDCGIISSSTQLHLIEFKQGSPGRQLARLQDACEQVQINVESFLANGVLTANCAVDAHVHVGYPLTPYPVNKRLELAKTLARHFQARIYVAFSVGTELTLP